MSNWKKIENHFKSFGITTQFQHTTNIIPSNFTNNVLWENPKVFSSISALHYANEGILNNVVTKENNNKFKIEKYNTDVNNGEDVQYVSQHYFLSSQNGSGQKSNNTELTISDSSVIMLKFYIYYNAHAYHVNPQGSPLNHKPVMLGLKVYDKSNAGNPIFIIDSMGQLSFTDFSSIENIHTNFQEHIESVFGSSFKEYKNNNLTSLGGKTIVFESYLPKGAYSNMYLSDTYFSNYEIYVSIHRKQNNLELDNNNIFVFEKK